MGGLNACFVNKINPGQILDSDCAINWSHPLNRGLVSEWAVAPLTGSIGGSKLRNLVRGGKVPRDSTLTAVPFKGSTRVGGYGALSFNGSTSKGVASDAGLPSGSVNRSIAVWFNSSVSLASGHYAFNVFYGNNSASQSIFVGFGTDVNFGTNGWGVSTNGGSFATLGFNDGKWHHGVVTLTSGTWTIYIDGVSKGFTVALTTSTVLAGLLNFGTDPATNNFYPGLQDGIQIYNRALPPVEVAALYTESKRGNPNRWKWVHPAGAFADTSIQFDAVSNSGYQAATSSLSWSHTWSGSSRMLSVDISMLSVTDTVTAMTYGGANCTFIGAQNVAGGVGRVESWRICQNDPSAPAAGANTISVTISGSLACTGEAVSYKNVNQSFPVESYNGNSGINAGSGTDATVAVTPIANNTWIHAALATSQSSGITPSQTSRNVVAGALGTGANSDTGPISPAALTTMTFTGEGLTSSWAIGGYAIRPLVASGLSFFNASWARQSNMLIGCGINKRDMNPLSDEEKMIVDEIQFGNKRRRFKKKS